MFLFIGTPWVWLILFFIRRIVNCWANSSSKTNLSKKRELTESDVLTGVAENIIVGQPVHLGTGAVSAIYKPKKKAKGRK